MPTDSIQGRPVALFLFAHQDDEFGVFHLMTECLRQGMRVACAYLTRGPGTLGARRNAETRRVLAKLGVAEEAIAFAGDALGIDDATLPARLDPAAEWIASWMGSMGPVELICVPAWEGGHHDHDALHAISVDVAQRLGLASCLRQYALYNRKNCAGPFFKVLSPLSANGAVYSTVIPWRARLGYLRLCLSYPSQLLTWIGLFPFVLLHYTLRGTQTLQPVEQRRTTERPHEGTLYYEHRQFYRWEEMEHQLREWRRRRGT
jgi:LmbE family N-acetylglucosaminyl deacetylase